MDDRRREHRVGSPRRREEDLGKPTRQLLRELLDETSALRHDEQTTRTTLELQHKAAERRHAEERRRWRLWKWAVIVGLVVFTISIVYAFKKINDNQSAAERQFRAVTLNNCHAGNELRFGLREVVYATMPEHSPLGPVRDRALVAFDHRNCVAVVGPLKK